MRNELLSLEHRFGEKIALFDGEVQLRLDLVEDDNAKHSHHLSELYNIVRSHDKAILEVCVVLRTYF